MPPVIEFNEIAKPEMAVAFGGSLEVGHLYKLRNGYTINVIAIGDGNHAPSDWRMGEYVTGPMKGAQKWWNLNGLFQGMELNKEYKHHVSEEVQELPKNEGLTLEIGQQYQTKAGLTTTPVTLNAVYHPLIGGPVFECKLYKEDGTLTAKCMYNHMGMYIGQHKIMWPNGNVNSARTIVSHIVNVNGGPPANKPVVFSPIGML